VTYPGKTPGIVRSERRFDSVPSVCRGKALAKGHLYRRRDLGTRPSFGQRLSSGQLGSSHDSIVANSGGTRRLPAARGAAREFAVFGCCELQEGKA
jgi:hypothetical protein